MLEVGEKGRRETGRDRGLGFLRVVSASTWRGPGARALASALSKNTAAGGGGGGGAGFRTRCLLANAHPFSVLVSCVWGRGECLCDSS